MVDSLIAVIANLFMPYLVLSLVTMLLVELIAFVRSLRALTLQAAIRGMLLDPEGGGLAGSLYAHPLISSLASGGRLPPYIPTRLFSIALTEVILTNKGSFSEAVSVLDHRIRPAFEALIRDGTWRWRNALEGWYIAVMDQASGTYRSRTLLTVAGVGTALVVVLNFDALRITEYVSRRALVERIVETRLTAALNAKSAPATTTNLGDDLLRDPGLALPLGWRVNDFDELVKSPSAVLLKVAGLTTSALAVLLGAPLLFDTLNRFTIIRSTVKPYESFEFREDLPPTVVVGPAVAAPPSTDQSTSQPPL